MTTKTRTNMFRKGYYSTDVSFYEENDMNRDFDTRPRQAGGRTQVDYGRTVLGQPPKPDGGFVFIVMTAAVILLGLWLGGFAGGVV